MGFHFSPGTLSNQAAHELNKLMRFVENFNKLSVMSPLTLNRFAGTPVIGFNALSQQIPSNVPSGGLDVAAADGDPSYTSITTLRFDEVDGFSLSQPGAGIARVDLVSATPTQAGIVGTTSQTFAGPWTVQNPVDARDLKLSDSGGVHRITAAGTQSSLLFGENYRFCTLTTPSGRTDAAFTVGLLDAAGNPNAGGGNTYVTFYGNLFVGRVASGEGNITAAGEVAAGADGFVCNTLHGVNMGSGTDPIIVTGGIVTQLIGTAGDVLYYTNSNYKRLPIGTAGQVLTVTAGLPAWTAPGSSSISGSTTTTLTGYLKGDGANVSAQATPIPITDTAAKVSSVGLTMPGGFSVASSPVTSSGTIAVTLTGEVELTGVAKLFGTSGSAPCLGLWDSASTEWREIRAGDDELIFDCASGVFLGRITLGTDLEVTHGGTGASTASAARTNLGLAYATQADQETGTATDRVVAPGTQRNHPSAAKAWVYFTLSGTTVTVQQSYGVTSVTRTSAGQYTVTFSTAFSNANYAVALACFNAPGVGNTLVNTVARTTTTLGLIFTGATFSTPTDSNANISAVIYGDQ